MFVYDFKFDDLSKIVYNTWLEHQNKYPLPPLFYVINFDDLSRSHRCNPLNHETMSDSADTSVSRSKQLEAAIPPSTISSLSSGEFVGMVADDPDCKIDLKMFHCNIINDHEAIKKEQEKYKEIPLIRKIDNATGTAQLPADKTGRTGYYPIGDGKNFRRTGTVPHGDK